jgi:LysM repeat protein
MIILCMMLTTTSVALTAAQDEIPASDYITYVIQPGDTLVRIALRYNTTVSAIMQENGIANRSLIYWGQTIRIPTASASQQEPAPQPAIPSGATTIYTVRPGDLLNRIARLHDTTIEELLRLNPEIGNANVIYVGQELIVPARGSQSAEPATVVPETTPGEETVASPADPVVIETVNLPQAEFTYGVEANLIGITDSTPLNQIMQLGAEWVKHEVYWRDYETAPGVINFEPLDSLIDLLEAQRLNILLTVTYAPDWARGIQEENGPPDNPANYGAFMSALAARYTGRVQAYQVWNEPNLRSRWKSPVHPIGAASYIELLRHGHDAVKAADPDALIISAGLAPTGFNDAFNAQAGNLEVNAIDDRVFLRSLYQAGLADYVDAVGAHPMGWANPPDIRCCSAAPGVFTHYENEHFYFLSTLESYRQIMIDNADSARPIWVTKFGWGTYEGVANPPSDAVNVFIGYLNQAQQAQYLTRALEIGQSLGYIGPMFIYNLNACQVQSVYDPSACFYSLTDSEAGPRPAFDALAALGGPLAQDEPQSIVPPIDNADIIGEPADITPEVTAEG